MAGVNKVIIVGHLGSDPDLKTTSNDNSVCRLSVATTRNWKNKQTGESQQETEWHRVTVWGKQAEHCEKYLSKGRQVYVEGRLRTSSYEKEGVKCYSTEVVAEMVQFLGGKGERNESEDSNSGNKNSDNSPDPDDAIPF